MNANPRLTATQRNALAYFAVPVGERSPVAELPRMNTSSSLVRAGLLVGSLDGFVLTDAGRGALGLPAVAATQPRVPAGRSDGGRFAARAVAAATPRDEVTVTVDATAGDDEDVMQCDLFGHELAAGRCQVCGDPDPRIAAVLADAATYGATITSEPGVFGVALGVLGFGEGERGDSWTEGLYWAFDHPNGVRAVCYPDDGDRVALIGFDPIRPKARLVTWKCSFDGSTPQTLVLSALAAVLGVLPAH
jgi:hypothetical protein